MDTNGIIKRMMLVVILVLITALSLAWLLSGKKASYHYQCFKDNELVGISDRFPKILESGKYVLYDKYDTQVVDADNCKRIKNMDIKLI